MKFLKEMFTSPDDDISSKRVCAFILIISGIIFIFLRPEHWQGAISMIGSGVTLLGVMAITKT